MDPTIILLTILLLLVGVVLFFQFRQKPGSENIEDSTLLLTQLNELRRELQDSNSQNRQEVQSRLDVIHQELSKNVTESNATLQKHFRHTSETIKDVTERLSKLDSTNKQILGFSEQLQNLENILKNPKHRGILGEYWLETLLGQVLQPTQYKMQYDLGVGDDGNKLIPDAAIFIKDLIIPIDAKFSLENYNKISQTEDPKRREALEKEFKSDVKKRIDETARYIQPEKGTTNFAFMFVPAEGVYHNLVTASVGAVTVNTRNLVEYAFEKGVVIVAPTSFFAYLQTVIMGLKALQIEESVTQIQKQAEQLMKHLRAYEDHHNRVGKHLETTIRAYSASSSELKKIDKDIYKITDGAAGKQLEPAEVERQETLDVI